MDRIPDGSVDMILSDLPYGTTEYRWDSVIPFEPLWAQYMRIAKRNAAIVLTAAQPFTTALIASNMEIFKYCWVWDKVSKGDVFNAKNKPLKQHEDICVFSMGATANGSYRKMSYYPQGIRPGNCKERNNNRRSGAFRGGIRPSHAEVYVTQGSNYPASILTFSNADRTRAIHPTQKPVALFEYLIRTYTSPGELVLDSCIGSGTTAIAAINTDRHYIGFEKDPKYFAAAQRRIEEYKPQLRLAI